MHCDSDEFEPCDCNPEIKPIQSMKSKFWVPSVCLALLERLLETFSDFFGVIARQIADLGEEETNKRNAQELKDSIKWLGATDET